MEVLIWICGVVVGVAVTTIITRMRRIGTLYIVDSHLETEPQLICNLDRPIKTFMKKRFVMFALDRVSTRE